MKNTAQANEKHSNRPAVLLVDDINENLLVLEAVLRRDDAEILTANSARAALEILLERTVALAIIDVRMPEIDGFALAELMRGVQRTRSIPIIFVTAGPIDTSRIFKGYEKGAVDFLCKPVDMQILRSKIDVFVRLEKQRQQIVQADHMLQMFIGILGHDLRNPLYSIVMSAELLQQQAENNSSHELVARIQRNCDRMERMIEQLLDLTRIRLAGGVPLRLMPADLRSVAEQVIEEMPDLKGRVTLQVSGNTTGFWDMDRLAQVVSNLVANAVRYSPPQTPVRIDVRSASDDAVLLNVTNAGEPIPKDLRGVLFEPFRRGKAGGLGLGLFVCKEFVSAHGGTIELKSSDESETCFSVRLPRRSPENLHAIAV